MYGGGYGAVDRWPCAWYKMVHVCWLACLQNGVKLHAGAAGFGVCVMWVCNVSDYRCMLLFDMSNTRLPGHAIFCDTSSPLIPSM